MGTKNALLPILDGIFLFSSFGNVYAVGAAEERLTDLPLRRCGRRSAGLMAEAPPVLPLGPASGSRGRASGRYEGRAARGGHPALGAGLLLPPGAAHS